MFARATFNSALMRPFVIVANALMALSLVSLSGMALSCMALSGCESAKQDPHAATASESSVAHSASSSATPSKAVRVYIDPVTGETREPTNEELAAEATLHTKQAASVKAQPEAAAPREITLPSGAIEVVLDKSSEHSLQACIQKDGTVKMDHACNSESASAKR